VHSKRQSRYVSVYLPSDNDAEKFGQTFLFMLIAFSFSLTLYSICFRNNCKSEERPHTHQTGCVSILLSSPQIHNSMECMSDDRNSMEPWLLRYGYLHSYTVRTIITCNNGLWM